MELFELLKQGQPHRIAVTYRKQKIGEELRIWQDAKNAQLDILIGTRPAVFTPMCNLGLIIIEEEDGYGYKEEQAPYYHAREVALMRAQLGEHKVILAGRTPTLESYYAIKTKKMRYIGPEAGEDEKSEIKIVDMRQYGFSRKGARPIISPALGDRIQKALTAGKKIIIFVNRKGFAASAYCPKCGLVLTCEKCSRGLAFYSEEKKLVCNLCGLTKPLPSACPQCGARYIKHKGFGIERIKSQLHLSYPQAKICRIDKEHDTLPPDAQIILATEMIFHREQVPAADVVAAIDLDKALQIVNYRGNEKLYSLVHRLKTIVRDELLIQTAMPEHYQQKEFIHFNIQKLFDAELRERKALSLPPFAHLAAVSLRGKDLEHTKRIAFEVYEKLKDKDSKVMIFEPTEGLPAKLRGKYRFNILLKAKNPFHLSDFLRKHLAGIRHSGVISTIEIDPQ
ncbi:primosomal protein N' [bacterium]|nr:MAG: primosomal protein N' [bacterium]